MLRAEDRHLEARAKHARQLFRPVPPVAVPAENNRLEVDHDGLDSQVAGRSNSHLRLARGKTNPQDVTIREVMDERVRTADTGWNAARVTTRAQPGIFTVTSVVVVVTSAGSAEARPRAIHNGRGTKKSNRFCRMTTTTMTKTQRS